MYYNNRIHRTTKLKPQEVIEKLDEEFRLSFYVPLNVLDFTTKIQEIQYLLQDSRWLITPSPANFQNTPVKSDLEINYFFFELFYFLKVKRIINKIIRKRNS